MTRPIRLILAEDHEIMRQALSSLLTSSGEFTVAGEARNGRELLELAQKAAPDVVVMDINMPELNGIEATRQLIALCPQVKIIGLSIHTNARMISEMLKAGASGYVTKTSALEDLIAALRVVLKGQVYVCPEVLGTVMQIHNSPPGKDEGAFTKLTGREREVLQLLVEGNSTKEIAAKLGLSVPTVHTHRQHIMQKTGTRSVADLVRYALREGIISSGQ